MRATALSFCRIENLTRKKRDHDKVCSPFCKGRVFAHKSKKYPLCRWLHHRATKQGARAFWWTPIKHWNHLFSRGAVSSPQKPRWIWMKSLGFLPRNVTVNSYLCENNDVICFLLCNFGETAWSCSKFRVQSSNRGPIRENNASPKRTRPDRNCDTKIIFCQFDNFVVRRRVARKFCGSVISPLTVRSWNLSSLSRHTEGSGDRLLRPNRVQERAAKKSIVLITLHFLCFIHCFVCDTVNRMYLTPGWKCISPQGHKSNQTGKSGTVPIRLKGVNICVFLLFYSA